MKEIKTNNGKRGGWLVGKRHYDKQGNSLGGIKAIVTDAGGKPVELEGGEVIINREASKKHWKELSRINQSAGNGVAIAPPSDIDEDPLEEYEKGGKIQFNANHLPSKWIISFAEKIRTKHPEIWNKGGNIFGNEAYENLKRVSKRGYWLDSEEWMYIKWRAFVARHKENYQLPGVVAMLKWVDKIDKGWKYMKDLIEAEIAKQSYDKKEKGGNIQKYSFVEGITTDGKKVYKIFDKIPTHKEVYDYFKNSKHKNNNGVTLVDSEINIETLTDFDRTKFLKAADKIAIKNFGYEIADKNDLLFVFDKNKLNVFPFEAKLKNGQEVEISVVDGVILIKQNLNNSDKMKYGGQTPKQQEKIGKVMGEFKSGKLKSSSGDKVTDRKQAIAIALSEAGLSKYEQGGNILLAPNGKPSNLTPEQYKLVRTESFKNWFGDWENDPANASKVVDENGEPLMVYHGTNSKFNTFELKTAGKRFNEEQNTNSDNGDYGMWGVGFYFSPIKKVSKRYGIKLMKLFLNIRNPFVRNPNLTGSNTEFKPVYGRIESINLREEILSKGYDGVIHIEGTNKIPAPIMQIIAFEPNQIKLADGTNTTFSSDSDDIRFEKGGQIKNYDYIDYDSYTPELEEKLYKSAVSYFDKKVTDDYWHFSTQYFNGEEITYEVNSEKGSFWLNFKIKNNNLLLSSARLEKIQKFAKGGQIETYKEKYNSKYNYPLNESHSLEEISNDTGISITGLQQIYNKGIGAYKTNPESVRPNVKSKEQWAMARVYSAVMGGDASKIDSNELKMEKGGIVGFNKMIESEYLKSYKEDYNTIESINAAIAFNYMQQIAIKNGLTVAEIDFVNQSKNPKDYFQMTMNTYNPETDETVIIYTAPFIYVNDNHKVVDKRTSIEFLNSNWETIKTNVKLEQGGSIDQRDTVTMDIPLLIRTLELSREDITSDADLHRVVENLIDLKNKPVLTMEDYQYIADIEHKHLQKMEVGGTIEENNFEKLLSQAHTNLTIKMGRKDYAPNKDELQEEIDKIIMEKQFGSNNI